MGVTRMVRIAVDGRRWEVKDIVRMCLKAAGFDGLYNEDDECACEVDDLAPCGELGEHCLAGFLKPCDCGENCDFHIGPGEEVQDDDGRP